MCGKELSTDGTAGWDIVAERAAETRSISSNQGNGVRGSSTKDMTNVTAVTAALIQNHLCWWAVSRATTFKREVLNNRIMSQDKTREYNN